MCVKGNQKNLHKGLKAIAQAHQPIDQHLTHEQAHSRCEYRLVLVYDQLSDWSQQWPHVARLICVDRFGWRAGKFYRHRHHYISDLCRDAQTFAELIRGHWTIENQLHWPKDVVLGEDKATQRTGDTPANWSFVRNIFVNFARKRGFHSLAKAKRFFANRPRDVLLSLT